MKVVIFGGGATSACEDFLYLFDEANIEYEIVRDVYEPAGIVEKAKGADALVVTGMVYFPKEVIEKLDDTVKCIVRVAMGYEVIDVDACSKRGIYVTPISDYAMEEVAVHQCALILAVVRKVVLYDKRLRQGAWQRVGYLENLYPARRMSTLSMGLLGFGRIAKTIAKYLKAFGVTVYAYDPFLPAEVFAQNGVLQAETPELIYEKCDIISTNVHLTDATRHMINAESIAKMKDGVIIVNTGRGGLVDEKALIQGLRSGKICAAGLDVFENEPMSDPNHPLVSMENVVLTPHIAYQTVESFQELYRKGVQFAIEGAQGGVPYAVVNKNCRG